jgi:auxin efflux carrier family protein
MAWHGSLFRRVVQDSGTMPQLFDVGQEECSVIFLAVALTVWSTIFMSGLS